MAFIQKSNDYQYDYLQTVSGFEPPSTIEPKSVEISGYNIIYDQDKDILNQGSVKHIKNYFDKLTNNIQIVENTQSIYSINNRLFVIKLCFLIILLYIIYDFTFSSK